MQKPYPGSLCRLQTDACRAIKAVDAINAPVTSFAIAAANQVMTIDATQTPHAVPTVGQSDRMKAAFTTRAHFAVDAVSAVGTLIAIEAITAVTKRFQCFLGSFMGAIERNEEAIAILILKPVLAHRDS